jgi:hypothetical protein
MGGDLFADHAASSAAHADESAPDPPFVARPETCEA